MADTPKITLEQWASLVAVVDEGSYSRAAELLNKSQSTVSYAISRIEEQLDGQVLKVAGRKAELTELGGVMLRKARKLLDDANAVEQLAESIGRGWEAEVSIAVDAIYPIEKVLNGLEVFAKSAQQTRVRLLETSLSGTDEALLNGQADLVISASVPPGFIAQQLSSVQFKAIAHKDHALHQLERPITQSDLEKHRQVVLRDTGIKRNQDAGWLGSEQRITVSHFSTSVKVLMRGLAFAWLPYSYVEQEVASGELKLLNMEMGGARELSVYLISSHAERSGPAVKLLSQIFIKQT